MLCISFLLLEIQSWSNWPKEVPLLLMLLYIVVVHGIWWSHWISLWISLFPLEYNWLFDQTKSGRHPDCRNFVQPYVPTSNIFMCWKRQGRPSSRSSQVTAHCILSNSSLDLKIILNWEGSKGIASGNDSKSVIFCFELNVCNIQVVRLRIL